MNYTRIFSDGDLSFGNKFNLSMEASKHLSKVLRKKDGNLIRVFDGRGYSCLAEVTKKTKKILEVEVVGDKKFIPQQGIKIFLGLSVIKPDSFSFSIQKATELGVVSITPLTTERTLTKFNEYSDSAKLSRWRKIAINACQQCGEDWLPKIDTIKGLKSWCSIVRTKHKIVLYPGAKRRLSDLNFDSSLAIAIGPEGDFTKKEIELFEENKFIPVAMGNRILRAETAVISSLSAIRTMCGEF